MQGLQNWNDLQGQAGNSCIEGQGEAQGRDGCSGEEPGSCSQKGIPIKKRKRIKHCADKTKHNVYIRPLPRCLFWLHETRFSFRTQAYFSPGQLKTAAKICPNQQKNKTKQEAFLGLLSKDYLHGTTVPPVNTLLVLVFHVTISLLCICNLIFH